MSTRSYLIESILPEREISLIAGPSGSNKTTLLFQALMKWQRSEPILGFASHPKPFVYISADRSREAAEATMIRLRIDPKDIPLISGVEDNLETIDAAIKKAQEQNPEVKLIIIDGFASLVPGGKVSDYDTVARFLKKITRLCKKTGITVIGLVHATKTKENEKYMNPRDRILGSTAWSGFSETIFYIEPINAGDVEDKYRALEVMPRQSANQHVEFELDEKGALQASHRKIEMDSDINNFLGDLQENVEFEVENMMASLHIGKTKAYRVLDDLVANRAVRKVKRGVYVRLPIPRFLKN